MTFTIKCPVCDEDHTYHDNDIAKDWQFIRCPEKNLFYKIKRVNGVNFTDILSHQEEIYLDVSKDIFKNGRTTLREFSTFMTSLSSAAIATYFLIIGFVIPKDISFNTSQSIISAIPAFLFLICIGIFISSFFPSTKYMNLNSISSISEKHETHLKERYSSIIWGIALFAAAVASAITITVSLRFYLA